MFLVLVSVSHKTKCPVLIPGKLELFLRNRTGGSNPSRSATQSALQRKLRLFCATPREVAAICAIFVKCEPQRIDSGNCAAVVPGPISLHLIFGVGFRSILECEERAINLRRNGESQLTSTMS